jgi:hypothetical protein
MGKAMIKIRYRDPHELSPGLHAHAERHGRRTTVYLLPGLSAAQRRAALRRLQISARRGYGPRLPALQLALALAVDRVRTNIGWAGAVFRSHPAGSTVPVMVVSAGAIAFLALSAASIRVIHPPRVSGPPPFAGAAANFPLNTRTGASSPSGKTDPGSAGRLPGAGSLPATGVPGTAGNGAGARDDSGNGQNPGAGSGNGGILAGSADPTPAPDAAPSSAAPAAPSSAAPAARSSSSAAEPATSASTASAWPTSASTASAWLTPSASNSGVCVNLGSLGVCVSSSA